MFLADSALGRGTSVMVLASLMIASAPASARSYSPIPDSVLQFSTMRSSIGKSYYVRVTGKVTGNSIYGSNPYTDTSGLAVAAVHAGLVQPGQTAVIKVTLTQGLKTYPGVTANGVTSQTSSMSDPGPGSITLAADDGGDNPILPEPTNLTAYHGVIGSVYRFKIGSAIGGVAYGTNFYTEDSSPMAAAVHSGALASSTGGVVKVVMGPKQEGFTASFHNGMLSRAYEPGYSYSIYADGEPQAPLALPGTPALPQTGLGTMNNYRGRVGLVLYVSLTGSTQGNVYGSGVYTDDSSLAAAAVHAGLLADGATGTVKVEMVRGTGKYVGSAANGVTSRDYSESSNTATAYRLSAPDGQEGGANPVVTSATATAQVDRHFTYQVQATQSPTRYAAAGLPEGLSIDVATGAITGIPKVSGNFLVHLMATNAVATRNGALRLDITEAGVPTSDADRVFNWAEVKYPQLFPSHPLSATFQNYYFRYYPGNASYLAAANGRLHYLGVLSGPTILDLGPLGDWLGQAAKDGY